MKSFFLILPFIFASTGLARGGDVGNGGDAILCRPSPLNPFQGYHSLDFLVQYQSGKNIVPAQSLEQSLNRIEEQFKKKLPELLPSFELFKKNIFNQTDASQIHFWEKSQFGLVDLKDENLLSLLPENCRNGNDLSIVQAVIRVNPQFSGRLVGYYLFKYVPEVVDQLKKTNPVQLSFLIIHEWLWDLSDNVDRNRRINYWLHSTQIENWTREDLIKNLNGIGFQIPNLPNPVYSPNICPEDPEMLKDLFTKAKERKSNPYHLILGYGKAHQRSKLCDDSENTCNNYFTEGSPITYNGTQRFDFYSSISIEIFQNKLVVRSKSDNIKPAEHFSCVLNMSQQKIGICSPLILTSGSIYAPQLNFQPVLGKNCLRFSAQGNVPIGTPHSHFFNMMDYVIYFPAISF